MSKYICEARRRLPPTLSWVKTCGKLYYQNRITDMAVVLFIEDPVNFGRLYKWHQPRVAEDQMVADHHGVAVGTQIGWVKPPEDKEFYRKVAAIKREIKAIVRAS